MTPAPRSWWREGLVVDLAEPVDRAVGPRSPSGVGPGVVGVAAVVATPLVREGLHAVIRRAGLRWLGAVATRGEALRCLRHVRPDVVLVDSAVDPSGALIAELAGPGRVPVVLGLLNGERPAPDVVRLGRAAGAHGVVPLGAGPSDLVALILRAHRSRRPALVPAAPVRARGVTVEALPAGGVARGGVERLSPRQREVLEMIAAGMTSVEIADALVVSVETVRTHVKGVLRRLGAKDRAHAITLAYRTGLFLPRCG
ncbi:response regulator transcription factor [Actinosynnema sp. NPDC002837]